MPQDTTARTLRPSELLDQFSLLVAEKLAGDGDGGDHGEDAEGKLQGFGAATHTLTGEQVVEAIHAAWHELVGEYQQLVALRTRSPELIPVMQAVIERVPKAVEARRSALSEENISALVEVFMANDPLAKALPELEIDNAEAQQGFLEAWPVITGEQIAALAGHESSNRSATASRWKAAGRIFSIKARGRDVYPAFQFQDGQPRAVIAEVLKALPSDMSPWQTAFWFIGANGWLDRTAPVMKLGDPAAVVEAARHEQVGWMG